MRTISQILMLVSALALVLGAVMALTKAALLSVSGTGFTIFSTACSLFAIALHIVNPFGKKEAGA